MYVGYLFIPLFIGLFFVPVLVIYKFLEKNGRKNFWKFAGILLIIYITINGLIFYALSFPTID